MLPRDSFDAGASCFSSSDRSESICKPEARTTQNDYPSWPEAMLAEGLQYVVPIFGWGGFVGIKHGDTLSVRIL